MSIILELIESKKHFDGVNLVERMDECRTPAISIAIIEKYEICETYVHGVKQRGKEEKVTEDTLFQAASISKPVFAVAVMRLMERGIFDIDMDISDYLSGYAVPTFDNQKHNITLRQILSHHAGLNLRGFAGYQQEQEIPTIEQILAGVFPSNHLKLKLMKKPGTEFMYSGGGYVLAQKIMTDTCKLDFNDLMYDLVLSPFFMTHSNFSQPLSKEKINTAAFGYDIHNLQLPGGFNIMPELSAAGLWTTPLDLARFGIEIMKALKGENKLLDKNTADLLITKAYENSPYGLGFEVEESKKGLIFGHNGSNIGYKSRMLFCPNDGSGIVMMQNSDIGWNILNEVINAFKDIYSW